MTERAGVVLVDRPCAHVARVLINRPDKRNAIDLDVRESMMAAIANLVADNTTRAIVFGGVEGNFSAGGDLASMAGLDATQARARMQHIHRLCKQIAAIPLPVVTAIEGVGAGAAVGLALLGDHIVVGQGTRILFPFLRIGLTPDWGQLLTLPARIGVAQARKVLTGGAVLSGADALQIGLADEMEGDKDVMAAALRKAEQLAALPSSAFMRTKARLGISADALRRELEREEHDQVECLRSDEFAEGFAAFRDKRAPDFVALAGRPR